MAIASWPQAPAAKTVGTGRPSLSRMDAIGLTVIATRMANRLTHNTVVCRPGVRSC
jgi:hypothetical protein